jgi:hypothetical protein
MGEEGGTNGFGHLTAESAKVFAECAKNKVLKFDLCALCVNLRDLRG